jgi:hypothetical protein
MTNVDTRYWKRVVAYFDRIECGKEHPEYDEIVRRGRRIAERAQALNDRVAELEAENERLRTIIHHMAPCMDYSKSLLGGYLWREVMGVITDDQTE